MTKIVATVTKSAFKMECTVSTKIKANPEKIWQLLTNSNDFPIWNSTVESITGRISLGEKLKIKSPGSDRIFKVKVSEFVPNEKMVWSGGFPPIFKGVRTFTLTANVEGKTKFEMTETLSGLMMPMISGSMPDFKPVFEQYATDLRTQAEKS